MTKLEYATGDINSDEKGTGARANKGKVAFTLIPFHLFAGCARVFMGGKLKYKEWNWASGMKWSACADCTLRHFIKWWFCKEDIDPESGESHLDHILCNILMLKHYTLTHQTGDDRPPAFTDFQEWLNDVNLPFDETDYLERNPIIAEKLSVENDK